jgi:PAS domain S-box-containing protein
MADESTDQSRSEPRTYLSIRVKMLIILTLLILGLLGVAYVSVDRLATNHVEEDLERQLLAVAQAAAAGVNGDEHREMVESDLPPGRPLDDPRYRRLVDWLAVVQTIHGMAPDANGDGDYRIFLYTYVTGPEPDVVMLVGSSGAVEHEPRGAEFRAVLANPSETLRDGLREPVVRVDSLVRDRWGTWITAAAPILDGEGQPVGAVGVDMRDTTVVALQNHIRTSLLPSLFAAGAFLLAIAALGTRIVSGPIRRLTAAVEGFAAGRDDVRPVVDRGRLVADEITDLTDAWEVMIARIQEREARLVFSEERYRALIDSLPGPAFVCDQFGHMSYAAPQLEDLLTITPGEWIGEDGLGWLALLHPDDWTTVREALDNSSQMPEVGIFEARLRRADGSYQWIEGRYARFQTRGDEWLVAGIILDIQARREAQQRLLDYNRELQIANQELQEAQQKLVRSAQLVSIGELAATVAHEINNPLAAVRGLAQILITQRADDAELCEPLEQIAANTDRMARTVRTLRSLGRQGSDEPEPTLLNSIVEDAAALVQAQLTDREIGLELELAADLPPVQGVAHLLEQVLINLLTNARDAVLEGGSPGTITIRTNYQPADRRVHLEVSDTGVGIPPENHANIFRPFFTTKPDDRGTGLGLSISYRIVQRHGGHLSFTSQPGGGTTFSVLLKPAEPAVAP